MKKIALLMLVLLVLIVGVGVYFMFFNTTAVPQLQVIRNFLPFGQNTIPSGQTGSNGDIISTSTDSSNQPVDFVPNQDTPVPVFRKITEGPVGGYTLFDRKFTIVENGKKVVKTETPIRYINRGTGNVFETRTDSLQDERLTNTTYPRIQEAFFTRDGAGLIIRTLDDIDQIKTYVADINTTSSTSSDAVGTLTGYNLDDNISFVEISPDTSKMLLIKQDSSGTQIQSADTKGNGKKDIYTSPLTEWLAQWYGVNSVALTSKPTNGADGVITSLDLKTNKTNILLSNIAGVTGLVNTTGDKILYSESKLTILNLAIYSVKTGGISNITSKTMPEKCVWSLKEKGVLYCLIPNTVPYGIYPDDWYQGVVSFSDNIFKIDIISGLTTQLYSPTNSNKLDLDGIRPMLSSDEKYFLFMDKKTGSLWSLQLP